MFTKEHSLEALLILAIAVQALKVADILLPARIKDQLQSRSEHFSRWLTSIRPEEWYRRRVHKVAGVLSEILCLILFLLVIALRLGEFPYSDPKLILLHAGAGLWGYFALARGIRDLLYGEGGFITFLFSWLFLMVILIVMGALSIGLAVLATYLASTWGIDSWRFLVVYMFIFPINLMLSYIGAPLWVFVLSGVLIIALRLMLSIASVSVAIFRTALQSIVFYNKGALAAVTALAAALVALLNLYYD